MIEFKISAPCRLSLLGEHAVKHGKTGLMAGINLRTTLTFKESFSTIQINFPQIDLSLQIHTEIFQKFYDNYVKNIYTSLYQQVQEETNSTLLNSHNMKVVHVFYYLLVYIAYKEKIKIKSFIMDLSTELIMDDELACPTSYTVCVAACLLHWSHLQKNVTRAYFSSNDLEKIKLYATRCKKIFSESGIIDVTACTYGSIIKYHIEKIINSISLHEVPSMTILLVDSKKIQDLDAQTQQVAKLIENSSELTTPIIDSIDTQTITAYDTFHKIVNLYKHEDHNYYNKTKDILALQHILLNSIRINQNLLNLLKVTHTHLEEIDSIAREHGMCGKYTDIGSGRYAYIFCPNNVHTSEENTHITSLSQKLKDRDFNVTKTTFAHSGVETDLNNITKCQD